MLLSPWRGADTPPGGQRSSADSGRNGTGPVSASQMWLFHAEGQQARSVSTPSTLL